MDRRNFLKAMGLADGAVALPSTPQAKSLDAQVSEHVLDPQDIMKDPTIGPMFDMNDDVAGLAGYFTLKLCEEWIRTKEPTVDETMALLQWGLRQPACIGMLLAKAGTIRVLAEVPESERVVASKHPVFKQVYTRYGKLLASDGHCTVLSQWCHLRT